MTNAQIILAEQATHNITEDLHTYARWKQLGYKVKAGQHAVVTTQLWKHTASKKEAENEDEENASGRCYLHKAFLFSRSQVERVEESNNE